MSAGIRPGQRMKQRHADAALVERALAGPQRPVGRHARLTAVVAHEHDDRAVRETQFIEPLQQHSYALVDGFQLGGQVGIVLRRVGALAGVGLAFVLGDQLGLAHQSSVDGIMAQVEEERLVVVPLDEVDRFAVEAVDQVFSRAGQMLVDRGIEMVRMVVASAADSVRLADDHFVEAVRRWRDFLGAGRSVAGEMPFADEPRGVAALLEQFGERQQIRREMLGIVRTQVVVNAGPNRILPGHQRGAKRRADGRGGIGLGESHALAGQAVEMRRFVEAVATAAQLGPSKVVGQHEDHVRRRRRWFCGRGSGRQECR